MIEGGNEDLKETNDENKPSSQLLLLNFPNQAIKKKQFPPHMKGYSKHLDKTLDKMNEYVDFKSS